MWPAFLWLWVLGGGVAAVLFEVANADSERIARAARVAFAIWISLLLLGVSVFYVWQNTVAERTWISRSGWWLVAVAGGIPLMAVCALGMRTAYRGRRLWLFAGLLLGAVEYVLFPLGYVSPGRPLHGLARFEHVHHVLDVVALSLPALVLLAGEIATRGRERPDDVTT